MCRPLTVLALGLSLLAPGLALAGAEPAATSRPSFAAMPERGSAPGTPALAQPKAQINPLEVEPILGGLLMRPADISRLRQSVHAGTTSIEQLRTLAAKRNAEVVALQADPAHAARLDRAGTRNLRVGGGDAPVFELDPSLPVTMGGPSNCCTAHGGLGCDDPACEAAVCAVDSFCCNVAWDSICANQAQTLCGALCSFGAPPNDDCTGAIPVNVGDVVAGTTIGATGETVPTCGGFVFSPGVWYSVTGTGNQITVDTCNLATTYDTVMTVFCGDCGELFCAGFNDDACGLRSSITFCSAPGVEYLVFVHGFFNTGNFTLTVSDGPACNNPPSCAPCIVDCPPDADVIENEPNCGLPFDMVNGGCNGTVIVPPPGNCGTVHGGVGCSDPACQAAVCAVDGFCCAVFWDGLCVAQAMQICGVATQDGLPIECGDTVCGSGAWDPSIGFRDTDWYTFTLDEPSTVSWTVESEFQGLIGIIDGSNGALNCGTAALVAFGFTNPCSPLTVTSGPLLAGSYWAFVAPLFADAVACPSEYTATLECESLCGPTGCSPCDLFKLLQPLVPNGQQGVPADHPCAAHATPVITADHPCCDSIRDILPLLPGVVDGTHARLNETHPCWLP